MSTAGLPRVGRCTVHRGLVVICVIGPMIAATWALQPLPHEPALEPQSPEPPAPAPSHAPEPIDIAVFSAPVWVAARVPDPPPPPAPVAPPPPLRLQLLAIVRDDAGPSAVLYDEAADRIVVARAGEALGPGRAVSAVRDRRVEITDSGDVRTLALQEVGR